MKIKNSQLFTLTTVLSSLKLEDQSSRARRRFLRLVTPYVQDLNEARNELKEKFADKEKNGKPKIEENKFSFTPENKKLLNTAVIELGDEEIDIDMGKSGLKDTLLMKSLLSDNVKEFAKTKGGKYTAEDFDRIESITEVVECLK